MILISDLLYRTRGIIQYHSNEFCIDFLHHNAENEYRSERRECCFLYYCFVRECHAHRVSAVNIIHVVIQENVISDCPIASFS